MQPSAGVMAMFPLLMPSFLVDEKDAYICWLKSEFAAANAIIDSLCQHVWSISSLGDYDAVFSSLDRRRCAWTPALYMQQYLSVADVVKSLQEVAQKKQQVSPVFTVTNVQNVASHDQQTSSPKCVEKMLHCQPQVEGKAQSHAESPLKCNFGENAGAPQEAGDRNQPPQLPINTTARHSENGINSRDVGTTVGKVEGPDDKIVAKTGEQKMTTKQIEGLDVDGLLETEVAFATTGEDDRHAMIKKSLLFQCCEFVDGKTMDDGERGELYENVFNDKEIDELVKVISQLQAAGRQGLLGCTFSNDATSDNKPDTMQFKQNVNEGAEFRKNGDCLTVPRFLQAMIKWLISCDILSAERTPDSCLVSIFEEGHFSLPSTDQVDWERPICVVSLSGNSNMVFGHSIASDEQGGCKGPFEVTLPAGSVLILEENFVGILQKAVPVSPTKRILITLGKAANSNNVGLTHEIAETKARWAQNACHPSTLKQGRKAGANVYMSHTEHVMPNHSSIPQLEPLFPFTNAKLIVNPYSKSHQEWSPCPSELQSTACLGTGVFLPSIYRGGLLMSVTANCLGSHRLGNAKKNEKRLKVGGSFDSGQVK